MPATVFRQRTNNAWGQLVTGGGGIDNSTLTITLNAGEGARYPATAGPDFQYLKITDDPSDFTDGGERVKIVSRTGDVLTVEAGGRGVEGTTASAWDEGAFVLLVTAAADFDEITAAINNIETGVTALDSLTVTGAAVINEGGTDVDFRVEGDGQANALFVQGSDGFVGVGHDAPLAVLDIETGGQADPGTLDGSVSLRSTGPAGDGNFGPSLIFSQANGAGVDLGMFGVSIASQQHTSDGNAMGLSFFYHSGSSVADRLLAFSYNHIGRTTFEENVNALGDLDIAINLGVGGNVNVGGGFGSTGVTITSAGAISADGAGVFGGSMKLGAQLNLAEISTPTPVANHAAIWTETDNALYFQDGAGNKHLVHGSAFSSLWDHNGADGNTTLDTVMTNTDQFYKVVGFQNLGQQDDLGNVTGSLSTDDLTIGANGAGRYDSKLHGSLTVTAGGGDQSLIVIHGIEFGTPKAITGATATSPIVITIVGHGFLNGDMVTIPNMPGGEVDEANGDWIVTNKTDDTFELVDLGGAASSGSGSYTSGGTVDVFYDGGCVSHRIVSTSELGSISTSCRTALVATDKVGLYVANTSTAGKTAQFAAVSFGTERFAD